MTDQERIEELERENQNLKHRIQGHREAIARWRRRVGASAPVAEMTLEKTELYRRYNGDWEYKEFYLIPIEPAPEMVYEAYAWLGDRGLVESCERLFFDLKKGWVAILVKEWLA